ncbi:MAG TPA: hypothetical protein VHI93_04070, partial [Candidatus Thermoplasmatota archaeon]|nr:hypothetical protein [Candidatus Thermoplasmatota archaeon]
MRPACDASADDSILGYTALNNIWIKDHDQVAYGRPLRVYDNHCPTGPVVVTRDELDWRGRAELEIQGIGRLRHHVTRVDGAALTFVISVKKWLEQGGEDFERAAVERAK